MIDVAPRTSDDFSWIHEVSCAPSRADKMAQLQSLAQPHKSIAERAGDAIDRWHRVAAIYGGSGGQTSAKVSNVTRVRHESVALSVEPLTAIVTAVLDQVQMLHSAGNPRAASDKLLAFIDKHSEPDDCIALNTLVKRLAQQLEAVDQQYEGDRGQARIINVLAMTAEREDLASARQSLRSTFSNFLVTKFGRSYADALLVSL